MSQTHSLHTPKHHVAAPGTHQSSLLISSRLTHTWPHRHTEWLRTIVSFLSSVFRVLAVPPCRGAAAPPRLQPTRVSRENRGVPPTHS